MSVLVALALVLGGKCPYLYEAYSPACNDGNVRNGYWAGVWWVPRYISEEEWYTPQPAYSVGRAVWYAKGVMEANLEIRQMWGQIPVDLEHEYVGTVALMSPAHIGQDVWLRRPGHDWEGPFLVVDCAQQDDMWWILEHHNEVVEVDWETKERWGIDRPLDGVEVATSQEAMDKAEETGIPPTVYWEYWLNRALTP